MFGHGATTRVPSVVPIVTAGRSPGRPSAEEHPDSYTNRRQKQQATDNATGDGAGVR